MQLSEKRETRTRLGVNYLADTLHYGVQDAQHWATELINLGAQWILLQAPTERAIPETFLMPFIDAGINPVLHFNLPNDALKFGEGYQVLFNHYARLGVKYAIFYDLPNVRQNWTASVWAQEDLVERFLDQFLPLAELALYEGLTPVFPALEPGGDYWDLAFLRAALKNLQRRGNQRLLDSLVLAINAQAGNRPLDWGAGGLDRWPGVRPYQNQPGMQDQRGFRTFDWYMDICYQELGKSLPFFLLRTGSQPGDQQEADFPMVDQQASIDRNLSIIRWLHHSHETPDLSEKAPDEIIACFFDLNKKNQLPVENKLFAQQQPFVDELRRWAAAYRGQLLTPVAVAREVKSQSENKQKSGLLHSAARIDQDPRGFAVEASSCGDDPQPAQAQLSSKKLTPHSADGLSIQTSEVEEAGAVGRTVCQSMGQVETEIQPPSISHYVLLPLYAWGAAEWDLELIAPLIQEGHPTIGFSLTEAGMADHVTVVGGKDVYSDQALDSLRRAGCVVERMLPDGTLVATL